MPGLCSLDLELFLICDENWMIYIWKCGASVSNKLSLMTKIVYYCQQIQFMFG